MSSTNKKIAIIGAGVAGLLAAVTAADRGVKVMLFEKMPKVGLKRVQYSFLTLAGVARGEYRRLSLEEVKKLYELHK